MRIIIEIIATFFLMLFCYIGAVNILGYHAISPEYVFFGMFFSLITTAIVTGARYDKK